MLFCCLMAQWCLPVTPRTVAHQAPLSVEFARQAHWSGLPFLSRLVWRRLDWTCGEGKRNHWILGRGSSMGRFPFSGLTVISPWKYTFGSDVIWDRDQTGSKDKDLN